MSDQTAPIREVAPGDVTRVLALLEQVEQEVGAFRTLEEEIGQQREELERREAELEQRTEAYRTNLASALEHMQAREAAHREQRKRLAARLRELRQKAPRRDPGGLGARRRELEQVRQCLEATEAEMVHRWATPWSAAIVLMSAVAMLLTVAISYAAASRMIEPTWRATMVVDVPDVDARGRLLESLPEGVTAVPGEDQKMTLVSIGGHEDAALAPLVPVVQQVATENRGASPFAGGKSGSRIVQPPSARPVDDAPARWRVAGRLSIYGLSAVATAIFLLTLWLRRSRRVMDEALRDKLSSILSGATAVTTPAGENRYARRVL